MSFKLNFNHPINAIIASLQPTLGTHWSCDEVYCGYIYKDNNIEIKVTKNCFIQIPFDFLLSNWNQLVLYGNITQPMKQRYKYIIDRVIEQNGSLCIKFNMDKLDVPNPYKARVSRIMLGNISQYINKFYGKYLLNSSTKMLMSFELKNYNRGYHDKSFLRIAQNQVYNVFYDYRINQCQVKRMMSLNYLKKNLKNSNEKCFVQSCDTTHIEWYVGKNQYHLKSCVYNNKYKTSVLLKQTIHDIQNQISQYEFKKSLNKIKCYLQKWLSNELINEIVRFYLKNDIFYLFKNSNF